MMIADDRSALLRGIRHALIPSLVLWVLIVVLVLLIA